MPRQTGYEDDWINVLNGVSNLANTLTRTKAQGLQIKEAESEADRKRRELAVANRMTTGLQRGETPEQLAGLQFAPGAGQGWAGDYNQINKGAPQNDRVAPEDFTRSSDRVGSSEVAAGLDDALTRKTTTFVSQTNDKANAYVQKLANMPIDEVSKIDPRQYGKDALAFRIAQGKALAQAATTDKARSDMIENRNKVAGQLYGQFNSGIIEAENMLRSGDTKTAMQVMANVINQSNNSAYKAKVTDKGIQLYVTEDGVDKLSDSVLPPQEALEKLKGISKTDFYQHFHAAAEHARQQNIESLEKPILMTDGKRIYQTIKTSNPLTSDFTHELYDIQTGEKAPFKTLAEARANGVYNVPAKGSGSGDKNMDVNGMKYQEEQAKRAFLVEAKNEGLPVALDMEGNIVAAQPLTASQKLKADTMAGKYQIGIGWDKGSTGRLFWKSDVFTPGATAYGARGLQAGPRKPVVGVGDQARQIAEEEVKAAGSNAGITVGSAIQQFVPPENAPIRKAPEAIGGFLRRHILVDPEELKKANAQY